MPRKRTLKQAHKYCWNKFSQYVRMKERGVCFTCDKRDVWKNQQAGHFVHRDCLDFDERNIHCQCPRCNKWLNGNLIEYAVRLEKLYGFGIIRELKKLGDKIRIFKVGELEKLAKEYDNKIKELNT